MEKKNEKSYLPKERYSYCLSLESLKYTPEKYARWLLNRYRVPFDDEKEMEISKQLINIEKTLRNGDNMFALGEKQIYELSDNIVKLIPNIADKSLLVNEIASEINDALTLNVKCQFADKFISNNSYKENIESEQKVKNKLKPLVIVISLIIIIFFTTIFSVRYFTAEKRATNSLATYFCEKNKNLTRNGMFLSFNKVYTKKYLSKKGIVIKISGSAKLYYNQNRAFKGKIIIPYLLGNEQIKSAGIYW